MTHEYNIAGLRLRCEGASSDIACAVPGFSVFETSATDGAAHMIFHGDMKVDTDGMTLTELDRFDFPDVGADCFFYRFDGGHLLRMVRRDDGYTASFAIRDDSREAVSDIAAAGNPEPAMLRFGLWMMLGIVMTRHNAAMIHSSVIVAHGRAVLFLGESGTGKSTHTRLWRENIVGARLLNDDSPVLHIGPDGQPEVSGSPWSGKTPCYVDRTFPIAAIVRLSQAPHNRIIRLNALSSIGAVLPSCPPAFAYDAALQDRICTLVSDVLSCVPVYHLECLPDADAARLAHETIFDQKR